MLFIIAPLPPPGAGSYLDFNALEDGSTIIDLFNGSIKIGRYLKLANSGYVSLDLIPNPYSNDVYVKYTISNQSQLFQVSCDCIDATWGCNNSNVSLTPTSGTNKCIITVPANFSSQFIVSVECNDEFLSFHFTPMP